MKFQNPKLLYPTTTPSSGSRTKIVMTNGCQDAISKVRHALLLSVITYQYDHLELHAKSALFVLKPGGAFCHFVVYNWTWNIITNLYEARLT